MRCTHASQDETEFGQEDVAGSSRPLPSPHANLLADAEALILLQSAKYLAHQEAGFYLSFEVHRALPGLDPAAVPRRLPSSETDSNSLEPL